MASQLTVLVIIINLSLAVSCLIAAGRTNATELTIQSDCILLKVIYLRDNLTVTLNIRVPYYSGGVRNINLNANNAGMNLS